jgi:hypothetical protein
MTPHRRAAVGWRAWLEPRQVGTAAALALIGSCASWMSAHQETVQVHHDARARDSATARRVDSLEVRARWQERRVARLERLVRRAAAGQRASAAELAPIGPPEPTNQNPVARLVHGLWSLPGTIAHALLGGGGKTE